VLRRAQSTLLASFARLAMGMVAGGRKTVGAGSHQRRRDKRGFSIPQIIGSTPQGLPGLKRRIRYGSDTVAGARWGPARSRADIAR
jgi:hypothetical protein